MLLFRMDTTGFFRYGQRHELKILLPRDKTKYSNGSTKTSVANSLAKHLIGRSHGHYLSRSYSNASAHRPNGIISNNCNRQNGVISSNANKQNGVLNNNSIRPFGNDSRSYSTGSENSFQSKRSSSQPPSEKIIFDCNSNGHPIPPVRRRRKNSTVSQKTRRIFLDQTDESSQGLVLIRMKADESGKFGFNVKGGSDQQQAVLVSRVTPGMPADRCYPRLNEGDQVLLINGKDISHMTHEQVVFLIKNYRDLPSGELVLTVKQNVYEPEGLEEPSFQYVPETPPEGSSPGRLGARGGALDESLLLLSEGLESGSLIAQFEQLYRRKPGLAVSEARKPENEKKNRYRDISPYDTTRVILTSAPGDYINASYVNMEIPGSGIINRYIACQGPLSPTSADFWYMVWEQQTTLVVMLTTVVEQGRIKCHRYWPRLYDSVEYGIMKISCTKEDETIGFAFREFTITNTQTNENRHVSHMQYLAWPDHGVPDDSSEFLGFVAKVRQARVGMVEPTIVHCSAGIGRTGVLILMETAQCLIEANEPVYPLDVVKAMRDQRAMMIQTASQYRFVCEAIKRVYTEGLVQPLAEYQLR